MLSKLNAIKFLFRRFQTVIVEVDGVSDFLASAWGIATIALVTLWSALWKAIALYTAGTRRQKGWFVALFFINTVGVLEIIYLAFFSNIEARDAKRRNYRRSQRPSGRRSAG
jgi:methionyl-tRNA synthetase